VQEIRMARNYLRKTVQKDILKN